MAAPATTPPATGMGDSAPVFVVTGPSGAGKGTLIRALVERIPELEVAVSATTRPQRPGEENGRDYWFLSDEEFSRRDAVGGFLEWVEYISHKRYGTLRSEIDRIAAQGRVCVLELELEGALRVQEESPAACTIFIAADVAELERRLRERATESTGEIEDRITLARYQLEQAHRFRYMVRNDDVVRASEVLAAIVERELALASADTSVPGRARAERG
jgi:guanylate kinase